MTDYGDMENMGKTIKTADSKNKSGKYDHYPPENPSFGFKLVSYVLILGVLTPLIFIFMKLLNRTRVIGRENLYKVKPGWVLASNHLTMLDDLFIEPIIFFPITLRGYGYFTFHAPEATNFYKNKLMSWFMRQVKSIPLVRGKGMHQEGMKRLISALKNKGVLHIYPEGTRSRTGKIGEPKPGVGRIICETGVPVIPVYYQGLEKILPIGSKFPKFGKQVVISIGEPMYFDTEADSDNQVEKWKSISKEISAAIHKEREKAEAKWGVKPIKINKK